MRPLYVVGTHRDVGKTTFCIGLISALRERGLSVGYTKPLGQRIRSVGGHLVHDDALVVSQAMDMNRDSTDVAVALTRGRVEREIFDLNVPELAGKVAEVCLRLRNEYDVVIVEGMGHVAAGACIRLSAGDVARILGAQTLLVGGGGIGRAIDDIALCGTFLTACGADFMGAVVNKVWPEKYRRVREATRQGLDNLGIRSFGTVPYEPALASPTMRQVTQRLEAEVLCGEPAMDNRVGGTIVAAMEAHHMVAYLKDQALVITPGDRSDNILAVLSAHALTGSAAPPVSGLVLTGGFRPGGLVMSMMADSGLPVLLCKEDTYSLATKLREMTFKITPEDQDRIGAAMCLVNEYVDVDAILQGLQE